MRVAIRVAILTLASIASSNMILRRQKPFPSCALSCLSDANLFGCPAENDTCLCNNAEFVSTTTRCFNETCKGDDLKNADLAAQQLCEEVGVDLVASASASMASAAASASAKANSGAVVNGINALAVVGTALGYAVLAF